MHGKFILNPGPKELIIPNTITGDGSLAFLQLLFQAVNNLPAGFYIGLTNASYTYGSALLADITVGEPLGHGYARQLVTRNNTIWDVSQVGGLYRARCDEVTFTASSNWDKAWRRMFLTNAASSLTVGTVYALSGPTAEAQTVLTGQGPTVAYEFWPRV